LNLALQLDETLHAFAQKHGIKEGDEAKFIGRLMMDRPSISKGGVGNIDSDEYVYPAEKRNKLETKGKTWTGKDWGEGEIVVADNQHVLGSIAGKDLATVDPSTLKIIIFTPKQIHTTDLSIAKGGFFERHPTDDRPTAGLSSRIMIIGVVGGCIFLVFILGLWGKRQ